MVKLGKIDYDELDIQIFSSIASVPNRSGRPVQVLSNVAWPESAGLVKPDPRLAVPTYRPYRLFPGCLIGRPGLYSLGRPIRLRPTHS